MTLPELDPALALRLPAPAKINLFLHIVGRRPDGYHLLQTAFRLLDWGDEITLARRDDGVIVRTTDVLGVPPESDLVVRAARALQAATGSPFGADIGVLKRIPMGGGLGGGSSDAATVLIALNRLWGCDLSRPRLQRNRPEARCRRALLHLRRDRFCRGCRRGPAVHERAAGLVCDGRAGRRGAHG